MSYEFKNWKEICESKDKRIKELEEKLQGKWIPCSKRLPEYDEEFSKENHWDKEYLVMIKGAIRPTSLYFSRHGLWFDELSSEYNVVAWMEMPEPYVERPKVAAVDDAEWKQAMMRHFEKVE